jgi:phenylacetic acid degradation operon negative regulatory protein
MKPKTEEFLYLMLWSADRLMHPTFRNLTDSFESWAYRNGFLRQLDALEKRHLVEPAPDTPQDRVYRLTHVGRLHALGGRDPQARWSRPWDGHWRWVVFDIPTSQNADRKRLRRYLRDRQFGCLQDSLWITPDPVGQERQILADGQTNVESLILIEGRPCAGESDAQLVAGAWDWERINGHYAEHLQWLDRRPSEPLQSKAAAQSLRQWAAEERTAWLAAVQLDPLLPERLLPPGYRGREAWQQRTEVFARTQKQLRTFKSI